MLQLIRVALHPFVQFPLPASVMIEMEDRFGVPVLEAYGMTEAAHQMSSNPLPPGNRVPGSVGPGTGVSVAIMDEDGALRTLETPAEVVIKGTNVINGYEDNPPGQCGLFHERLVSPRRRGLARFGRLSEVSWPGARS